jgi:glycosyltransferase involved in cell wall biosynthesis
VILGGVDTARFSPPPALGARDGALFVGRLLPHKGVDVLIDALPTRMPLRIIGREADQRYFEELRRRADGKLVSFDRDCDDAGLVEAYRRAACVVLPSVNRTIYGDEVKSAELLGQTLLEGMACGAPAIASNLGGMPEVVEDNVTGFLTPPGDAAALRERLERLTAHPEAIAQMGAAGRARVLARFTWPEVVSRCLEIYRAAL